MATTTTTTTSASLDRTNADDFGDKLKYVCLLFRFYSSIILVIVGERDARWSVSALALIRRRDDRLAALDQGLLIDENPAELIE